MKTLADFIRRGEIRKTLVRPRSTVGILPRPWCSSFFYNSPNAGYHSRISSAASHSIMHNKSPLHSVQSSRGNFIPKWVADLDPGEALLHPEANLPPEGGKFASLQRCRLEYYLRLRIESLESERDTVFLSSTKKKLIYSLKEYN